MAYTFKNDQINKNDLWEIRKEIYHSNNQGFYIFRNYIKEEFVQSIIEYWCYNSPHKKSHKKFKDKSTDFYINCPSYFLENGENKVFYNPFWSNNYDPLTNELSLAICTLRAQIEGKQLANEIMPRINKRCVIPRLIITKNGENIIKPHSDYGINEKDPNNIDIGRLQCTLFLSKNKYDYTGSGFVFTNNAGRKINIAKDYKINPGDLVIWKYNNIHEIKDIKTTSQKIGFVRMIFPLEIIKEKTLFNISSLRILDIVKLIIPKKIKLFIRNKIKR